MFLAFNYYIIREINRQNLFNMTFQTAGQIHLLFLDGIRNIYTWKKFAPGQRDLAYKSKPKSHFMC